MNSEQVLDFQRIRQKLADVCSSAIAKEYALNLQPMHNRQKLKRRWMKQWKLYVP